MVDMHHDEMRKTITMLEQLESIQNHFHLKYPIKKLILMQE